MVGAASSGFFRFNGGIALSIAHIYPGEIWDSLDAVLPCSEGQLQAGDSGDDLHLTRQPTWQEIGCIVSKDSMELARRIPRTIPPHKCTNYGPGGAAARNTIRRREPRDGVQ